jgi:exopolysaccharide biosynthesis WecB/TagA/CpsF family protein
MERVQPLPGFSVSANRRNTAIIDNSPLAGASDSSRSVKESATTVETPAWSSDGASSNRADHPVSIADWSQPGLAPGRLSTTPVTVGDSLTVLGVEIAVLPGDEALHSISETFNGGRPRSVNFANAHTLNLACESAEFRDVLNRSALVLNDGGGLRIAARWRGVAFPENLNGSDFTIRLLELAADRGWRCYFLGAKPGIAPRAVENLKTLIPDLKVAGFEHGFEPDPHASIARVREAQTDLLIVGMGNPRQEFWLDEHLPATGARIGMGVGAFLDFSAGAVPRAPRWMNRHGIEWLYRLAHEPRRLASRYLIGNPKFLVRAARESRSARIAERASLRRCGCVRQPTPAES